MGSSNCWKSCVSWTRSLFRRRPMYSEEEVLKTPLKRCLTIYDAIVYGLAQMIGAGIFALTGDLVARIAGPAACISYLCAGITNMFTALCYMEFASLIPRAGSVYIYTFVTLGELPAFTVGWLMVSDIIVSIATIAKAFSGTVNILVHGAVTNWTEEYVGRLSISPNSYLSPTYDFVGAGLVLILAILVATGARSSMSFTFIIGLITVISLVIITGGCFYFGSPESYSAANGGFAPEGIQGIINGAAIVTFAYLGYESIARASEEMINPVRDIPRAIMFDLVVGIIVYCIASYALAYLVPQDQIDISSPFVGAFEKLNITWLIVMSAIGALMATGASKISSIYVLPRAIYPMGDDGLIFRFFAHVEKRTQVPQVGLWVGAVLAALMALLINIETLANFVSLGYLIAFFILGIDLMVLRYLMLNDSKPRAFELNLEKSTVCRKSQQMPLRYRVNWIGDRFPVILNRSFFCGLLVMNSTTTILVSVVINFSNFLSMPVRTIVGIIVTIAWLTSVILLSFYRPSYNDKTYQTPLMPMAPVLTMFFNCVIVLRLSAITWARFGVWFAAGLLIYFGYGRQHSVARERDDETLPLKQSPSLEESELSYQTEEKIDQ